MGFYYFHFSFPGLEITLLYFNHDNSLNIFLHKQCYDSVDVVYLVLADWICYTCCCFRASMDLLLPISTKTCCYEHVKYSVAAWIGIHKSHSRSRHVELERVAGLRYRCAAGSAYNTHRTRLFEYRASNLIGCRINSETSQVFHLVNYVISIRLYVNSLLVLIYLDFPRQSWPLLFKEKVIEAVR